jgi:hypothetical protein
LLGDENHLFKQDEINAVIEPLGGFGYDNRAGLEWQLHHISAIRNREAISYHCAYLAIWPASVRQYWHHLGCAVW